MTSRPALSEPLASATDRPGTSSLRMVPVAVPVAMVAPVGLASVRMKVSSGSIAESSVTVTTMSMLVTFAAKVSVWAVVIAV